MQCTYHILGNCELARTKHGKLRLVSMFIPLILPILLTIDVYTHLGLTIFIHIYIDNNIYIFIYELYIHLSSWRFVVNQKPSISKVQCRSLRSRATLQWLRHKPTWPSRHPFYNMSYSTTRPGVVVESLSEIPWNLSTSSNPTPEQQKIAMSV